MELSLASYQIPWYLALGGVFVFLVAQRAFFTTLSYGLRASPLGQKRVIYHVEPSPKQIKTERKQYIWTLLADPIFLTSLFFLPFWKEKFSFTASSSLVMFLFHFVAFELLFYLLHRSLHSKSLYKYHRAHHIAHVTTPISAGSFHFVERVSLNVLFYAPMVIWGLMMGELPLFGVFICLFVNDFFNITLGHSNVDPYPKHFSDSLLFYFIHSPTSHAIHHSRIHGNYGLNTPWFDHLFGTAFLDSASMMKRVQQGQGFHRLDETCNGETISDWKDVKKPTTGINIPEKLSS